jgi:hypothetical protein
VYCDASGVGILILNLYFFFMNDAVFGFEPRSRFLEKTPRGAAVALATGLSLRLTVIPDPVFGA